jgi:23S rRNA pseudouridine2605 synthase
LQKLLAAAGLGSRREIEGWIAGGRVSLNGQLAKLGDRAGPGDIVAVDGKPVRPSEKGQPRVLLYHKPVGELVTRSDPQGRATVFGSLPPGRWIAVGRLDLNSSGLLLLTDSGELANRLMHPRYGLEREYLARVKGELSAAELARLRQGILLDGVPARFERIDSHRQGEGANRWYRVVLQEGRNREVRRLFEALGHPVSRLSRVRYGPLALPPDLATGMWRELPEKAVNGLFRQGDTAKISKL